MTAVYEFRTVMTPVILPPKVATTPKARTISLAEDAKRCNNRLNGRTGWKTNPPNPFDGKSTKNTKEKRLILDFIAIHTRTTQRDLRQQFPDIGRDRLRGMVASLESAGKIIRVGHNTSTAYIAAHGETK